MTTVNEYVQTVRTEIERLSMQHASADRLGLSMTKTLAPHTEFKIFGECEHRHEQIGWNGPWPVFAEGVAVVDEIGTTCNYEFSVCAHCCTDQIHGGDEIQREDCANANQDVFWRSCWPCQAWLDAGDALGIPRPEGMTTKRPGQAMPGEGGVMTFDIGNAHYREAEKALEHESNAKAVAAPVLQAASRTDSETAQVAGLQALVNMLDANPRLGEVTRFAFNHINVPLNSVHGDPREALQAMVTGALDNGATVELHDSGEFVGVLLSWGVGVAVHVYDRPHRLGDVASLLPTVEAVNAG